MIRPIIILACGTLVFAASQVSSVWAEGDATPTADQIQFFESKIRPVLIDQCLDCHSGEEPESNLSLESRDAMLKGGKFGPAIVPGKPKESLLISAINHDEFLKMPPKDKLSTGELIALTRWVKMGAPWPELASLDSALSVETGEGKAESKAYITEEDRAYWAFQPVRRPRLPKVKNLQWTESPLDFFVLAKLEDAGLQPAPPAERRALIRRATYDLTGLPPTEQDIDAFLNDTSPNAFARVIDRLLASPQYGERWGRHWLDVARYADSNGLDENLSYANAFRYRDYVIAALNADEPYSRFVAEQVAGDLLEGPDVGNQDRFVATGFLAIGPKMLAEDDPVKMQMDIIDEQINTLGQAFMGLTLGCARCHDHKFDPIPTKDYYSLAGIFKSTKTMENHKVVAVWYERPLKSKRVLETNAEIDNQVAAAKRDIDQIRNQVRERIATDVRRRLADYLMATVELDEIQARYRQTAQASAERFVVEDGFALIEAEAFQRGNVERLQDGYGEGIGVVANRGAGYLEFDLDVTDPGEYDLEIRYAAEMSRPFKLLVNGRLVAESVGAQVTGSWNPDGQMWFPESRITLGKGKNTIKFDSGSVYPHIDRFALVQSTSTQQSLAQLQARCNVSFSVVRQWQRFFDELESSEVGGSSMFLPWVWLRRIESENFKSSVAKLVLAARSDDGDSTGDRIPAAVLNAIRDRQPDSIAAVADIYQGLVRRADEQRKRAESDEDVELTEVIERVSNDQSPLRALDGEVEQLASNDEQARILAANRRIAELEKNRLQPPVAMGVTEAKPVDIRVHLRGSHIALGEIAPRGLPRVLAGAEQPVITTAQSGRLELARWLVRDDHPLTSRVMANRIWHWHFGRGIVASVDNFGKLGDRPTHPGLLDWLATDFVNENWSIKSLHRKIMLSSTYQMSTRHDELSASVDPENKLMWRVNRRRLSAEEIRDTVIYHGGGLDQKMGGSLLKVKNRAYVTGSGSNLTDEFDNRRRSVYLPVVRSSVFDVLQTLDFPDPAVIAGRRQTSTIAPQALMMMNSKLVEAHSAHCAARIIDAGATDAERITAAYQRLLSRPATSDEIHLAKQFLHRVRSIKHDVRDDRPRKVWQSFGRALMSTSEFVYVE